MVNPVGYSHNSRRYNRIDPRLPGPFGERSRYPAPSPDSRSPTKAMSDRTNDSDSPATRKRISVACQRCRKRKIRCSGDPGNGEPCQNCKSAGNESCQFLRVASLEAPFFNTPERNFPYDMDSARVYQARSGVCPPFPVPYTHELPDSLTRYGGGSSPASYQYASHWPAGYVEDAMDYSSLAYSQPQYYGQVDTGCLDRYANGTRGLPLYAAEAEVGYNCVQRSSVGPDVGSFSLSGVAASLPPASTSINRHLPQPVNRTSSHTTLASLAGDSSVSYGVKSSQLEGICSSSSSAIISQGTSASYDSSPDSGYSPPHAMLSSPSDDHRLSRASGCDEVYSGSSTSGSIFSDAEPRLRGQTINNSNNNNNDISYKYSDFSHKGSNTSILSNGQVYTVPPHPAQSIGVPGHAQHHNKPASATTYMLPISGGGGGLGTVAAAVVPGATAVDLEGRVACGGGSGTRHADALHARPSAGSLSVN